MDTLPQEVKLNILRNMTPDGIINTCSVDKEFSILCKDETLWRQLVKERFGDIEKKYGSWYNTYIYANRTIYCALYLPQNVRDADGIIIIATEKYEETVIETTIFLVETGSKVNNFTYNFIDNNPDIADYIQDILQVDYDRIFDEIFNDPRGHYYVMELYNFLIENLYDVVFLDDGFYLTVVDTKLQVSNFKQKKKFLTK